MKHRRKLVIALGAGAFVAPFAAFAQQQGRVWRVGYLSQSVRAADSAPNTSIGAFQQGMRELGYVEGKNLVLERRYADGELERLPGLAAELVQLKVDVIFAVAPPATAAAQRATATIPVGMVNAGDPVASGFVKSLAQPGGNITGLTPMYADISTKWLEMLRSVVPKLSRVAVLVNPGNAGSSRYMKNIQATAARIKVTILPVEAGTPAEIENAFMAMARQKAGAVIVAPDAFFIQQRQQVGALAAKYRLPAISGRRNQVEAGFLMSYGPNDREMFRRAATYVDRIFKGAKPCDLPVEQPAKFELFINRKTAKALGLTIPQSLLISADEVIE